MQALVGGFLVATAVALSVQGGNANAASPGFAGDTAYAVGPDDPIVVEVGHKRHHHKHRGYHKKHHDHGSIYPYDAPRFPSVYYDPAYGYSWPPALGFSFPRTGPSLYFKW